MSSRRQSVRLKLSLLLLGLLVPAGDVVPSFIRSIHHGPRPLTEITGSLLTSRSHASEKD